jgi:hypothetical protein
MAQTFPHLFRDVRENGASMMTSASMLRATANTSRV